MAKPYFNAGLYPSTRNCQVLDAQLSGLRDDMDNVFRGLMYGSKREVKNLKYDKELQFESQNCSKVLEDKSVSDTAKELQKRFQTLDLRIIGGSNKKQNTMLIGGAVILLIGLAVFIK